MSIQPATGAAARPFSISDDQSIAARITRADNIYIKNPRTDQVHGLLAFMRALGKEANGGVMRGARILGPSGSGKTTAIQTYIEQVNAAEKPDAATIPILYVPLQAAATPKRLFTDILTAMGDEYAIRGDEQTLRQRTYEYLRRAKVELIVIDEVQHLYHREGQKTAWNVTEALKRMLDSGIAPMAFSGTDEALPIFRANRQLNNRLVEPCDLKPLDIHDPQDRKLFLGFCGYYDRALVKNGILPRESKLIEGNGLLCLHEIAGGVMGVAANFIKAALAIALRRGAEFIETYDLSLATDRWAIEQGFIDYNPFLEGVRLQRKAT